MDGGQDEERGFLLFVNCCVPLQNSVGYNIQPKASVAIDGDKWLISNVPRLHG